MKLAKILIALILISSLLCGCAADEGFVIKGEGSSLSVPILTALLPLLRGFSSTAGKCTNPPGFTVSRKFSKT